MGNQLITKQFVHLFQCPPFRLGIEQRIADSCHDIESEKEVEELESHLLQRDRCCLGEKKVETPVGKGGDRVSLSSDLDREDFGWVDPGDDADEGEE